MNKSRFLLLSVCICIALTIAGCGAGNTTPNTTTKNTTAPVSVTTTGKTSSVTITTKAETKSTTTKATGTTTTKAGTTTTKAGTTTTTAVTTTKKTTATSAATQSSTGNDPFAKMGTVLDSLGLRYEKNWMYAEAIGAKEGYKYPTTKGTFELYLYDTGSDAYKKAVKDNAMELSGTLFPATIKNGFALYFYPNVPENVRNDITKAFFQ